ncbi:MAG: MarR family winged helix-turn-helix transcriptional regulator [Candidatus Saccharibacteria bacterium]
MSAEELQDNLYWNLLQVSMRAKHSLIRLAEKRGLTVMQLFALCSMEASQPVPMNFFSSLFSCDASNVTGIIDRLFTGGYIVRAENPQDRRVKVISLTPEGEVLKNELLAEIRVHDSTTLSTLSNEQKKQLQTIAMLVLRCQHMATK